MEDNKKKNTDDININVSEDINITESDISVSVNSKDGKQKEYIFSEAIPSDVIAFNSAAYMTADMGVKILAPDPLSRAN